MIKSGKKGYGPKNEKTSRGVDSFTTGKNTFTKLGK